MKNPFCAKKCRRFDSFSISAVFPGRMWKHAEKAIDMQMTACSQPASWVERERWVGNSIKMSCFFGWWLLLMTSAHFLAYLPFCYYCNSEMTIILPSRVKMKVEEKVKVKGSRPFADFPRRTTKATDCLIFCLLSPSSQFCTFIPFHHHHHNCADLWVFGPKGENQTFVMLDLIFQ